MTSTNPAAARRNSSPAGVIARMRGAAFLDVDTYDAVEHDRGATVQAATVVMIVAVAQAIGSSGAGSQGIFGGLIAAIGGWLMMSGITYLIGDKLLGGTATWGELLRTLGFAQAPGVLYVFAIIPFFGVLVRLVIVMWILLASVIAIRQALDFGTGRALITAFLGWLAIAIPTLLLTIITGGFRILTD